MSSQVAEVRQEVILVLNAGSSSIKFSLFIDAADSLQLHCRGQVEGLLQRPHLLVRNPAGEKIHEQFWDDAAHFNHAKAIVVMREWLRENLQDFSLRAVGHRVVHGGVDYVNPVRLTPEILQELSKLNPLAPLHQPHNLAPIISIFESQPELPQIACFDTAFHASQPAVAKAYALPKKITERGVMRYGFHGLSYQYIASVLPSVDERAASGRTVVLHLGNGASMTALQAGKSIASTMGFTAMDGLPMGTRCGNLDPGIVLYLLQELQMSADSIQHLLYSESGLLGVSGIASDMRTLIESDQPSARFAIELFVYRIVRELGSLIAALGGLDAIVFTGGIGENAALIRQKVCAQLLWLDVKLDESANAANAQGISAVDSRIKVWVIPTNEELMIAQQTKAVLSV
jgi:acetate kinase